MRKLLIFLVGLLSVAGFVWDCFILFNLNLSIKQWQTFAAAMLIFALTYFIPLSVLSCYLLKKEKCSLSYFWLSVFAGATVIGSLAGLLNYWLTDLLKTVVTNQDFLNSWAPSLVPPFAEESLKLILALIVAYLVGAEKLSAFILIGLGVGLGFQLSEDYTYVAGSFVEGTVNPVWQAFLRLETAFASHWLLTAMLTGACYILFVQKFKPKPYLAYVWLFSPFVLHILWNSPWGDGNVLLKLSLTFVSWFLFGSLFHYAFTVKLRETVPV